jgi:hypothetical protein
VRLKRWEVQGGFDGELHAARVGPFELLAFPMRFLVRRGTWAESGPARSIDDARAAAVAALRAHLKATGEDPIVGARVADLLRALGELERVAH